MAHYFVHHDGHTKGPLTDAQARAAAQLAYEFGRELLVKVHGQPNWVAPEDVWPRQFQLGLGTDPRMSAPVPDNRASPPPAPQPGTAIAPVPQPHTTIAAVPQPYAAVSSVSQPHLVPYAPSPPVPQVVSPRSDPSASKKRSRAFVPAIAVAALVGVVVLGAIAWATSVETEDATSPWAKIETETQLAVARLDQSNDSAQLRVGLEAFASVCGEAETVNSTETPPPTQLRHFESACEQVEGVNASLDLQSPVAPEVPVEPVYEKPDYNGAFRLSGTYYQEAGSGVVLQKGSRWYWLPNAVVRGGGRYGSAKGYVRPTGRFRTSDGLRVRITEVVSAKEYRADRKKHKEAVRIAEGEFEAQMAAYAAAKEAYPAQLEAYQEATDAYEAATRERRGFESAVVLLAADLGVDVALDWPEATKSGDLSDAGSQDTTPEWWCLCYLTTDSESGGPDTVCRQTETACEKLSRLANEGNGSAVPLSVSPDCTSVRGDRPWDALGSPEKWKPSSKSGSWWAPGECLFAEE